MKFILLGTGGSAGLPQIGGPDGRGDWGKTDPNEPRNARTRASIVIQTSDNKNILVDTSPDLRLQLTRCGIGRINALIYTHAHADHVAGIDEVRILNRIMGGPMPTYTTKPVLAELKQRFGYVFAPYRGGFISRPILRPEIIKPKKPFEIAGEIILPLDQDHGYSRSLGLRLGRAAYCTDVVRFSPGNFAALEGLDLLVVDCFTPSHDHPTHAGLPTVLSWVERLRPRRTVLTHLGPEMDYGTLRATLPSGVEPGYDGMVLEI
ncbi:MBL fold metallo-hydrolase [Acidocella sp. KAb 2-4]|uniref:MBL fold metallo-hydrolase n=1 Tax=Acidocella sp. KAb 2-4 TaxID=2885158 RepID=UPI001D08446D|nr:MBL fold metallo-hydrolase [Acidocella sp. KAb 2-4]MCB5943243.1 MBL fold metallo-hydrolase [Acidocella sp. KAb 2-4]